MLRFLSCFYIKHLFVLSLVFFAAGCFGPKQTVVDTPPIEQPEVQYSSVLQEQRLSFTEGTNPNAICPPFFIKAGHESYRRTVRSRGGERLVWQANLLTLSRQCSLEGTRATFKVGAKGRIIRPRGASANAVNTSLPVRVSVTKEDGTALYSGRHRVQATLSANSASNDIIFVNPSIAFDVSPNETFRNAVIHIGFDTK